ncbi:hypothetical protein [Clostridium sp. OS1-26]|uniref:hypothetical protein n=1 Tax=Clostridium sp. OS1-26 TaxID=3070681 RepID=UPI0027DF16A1|nr:hypothetical protein [Clostridium sp. OS1-26]WML34604.1 hypothetical protein RCG18_25585 [Clostridium sp. OS1-26]
MEYNQMYYPTEDYNNYSPLPTQHYPIMYNQQPMRQRDDNYLLPLFLLGLSSYALGNAYYPPPYPYYMPYYPTYYPPYPVPYYPTYYPPYPVPYYP